MAHTKIWPITHTFPRAVRYVMQPDKTWDGKKFLHSGIYLDVSSSKAVVDQMMATKRRWNKMGGRLAYHAEQAFKPGEVTPDQAHEIGVKLAEEVWGDRFEVLITTHLDQDHIHNHFIINSVSYFDGKKYHESNRDYNKIIRETSDRLCREYGLSTIEQPQNSRSKSWSELHPEDDSPPTIHILMYQDMDNALQMSHDLDEFYHALEQMGYKVKRFSKSGKPLAHPAIKPPSPEGKEPYGFFRLYKFAPGYTEEDIIKRLEARAEGADDQGQHLVFHSSPAESEPSKKQGGETPRREGAQSGPDDRTAGTNDDQDRSLSTYSSPVGKDHSSENQEWDTPKRQKAEKSFSERPAGAADGKERPSPLAEEEQPSENQNCEAPRYQETQSETRAHGPRRTDISHRAGQRTSRAQQKADYWLRLNPLMRSRLRIGGGVLYLYSGVWLPQSIIMWRRMLYYSYFLRRMDWIGLRWTYTKFAFILKSVERTSYPKYPRMDLRRELHRLHQYSDAALLLHRHKIDTMPQLQARLAAVNDTIHTININRKRLRYQIKSAVTAEEAEHLRQELQELNETVAPLYHERALLKDIMERSQAVEQIVQQEQEEAQQAATEQGKGECPEEKPKDPEETEPSETKERKEKYEL